MSENLLSPCIYFPSGKKTEKTKYKSAMQTQIACFLILPVYVHIQVQMELPEISECFILKRSKIQL